MTKLNTIDPGIVNFGQLCFMVPLVLYGTYCDGKDLKLGVLIPWTQSRPVGPFMGSAFMIGLNSVQKNSILTNVNLTWVWNDSYCKGLKSNEIVLDWWEKNEVDAIIGPACCVVCEEIGAFLGAVNMSFISYGCSSSFLTKKSDFPTFSSILGNTIEPVASVFVLIAQTFKWRNIVIVTTMESDHMRSISNIIRERLHEDTRTIHSYYIQTTVWGNDEKLDMGRLEKMKQTVIMTKNEATVVYLLMYNSDVINFLHLALKENMCDGSYIFVTTEMSIVNPNLTSLPYTSEDIEKSLNGLLSIEMKVPKSERWMKFAAKVVSGLDDPKFSHKSTRPSKEEIHPLAGLLHDAVLLWALAVNHTIKKGENPKDGVVLTRSVQRVLVKEPLLKRFSMLETDKNRAVIYGLSILKFGRFVELFYYNSSTKQLIQSPYKDDLKSSVVALHDHFKEFPECGYNNEFCPSEHASREPRSNSTVFIVFGTIIVMSTLAVLLLLVIRKQFMKRRVSNMNGWKINWSDIADGGTLLREQLGCIAKRTYWPLTDDQKAKLKHLEISVGVYRENPVAVKQLHFELTDIKDETVILELEQMLEMKHLNINEFYGICLDAPHVCVVSRFAHKGSLWDLIRFKDFSLPMDFRMSFAIDVASGMRYIHQSPLGSHGQLTSTNCLVDNTWTCKVADFGLGYFKRMQTFHSLEQKSHRKSKHPSGISNLSSFESSEEISRLKPLWMSPELLRIPAEDRPIYGTQAGDVYSYGIILQELILKGSPFANELEQLPVEEIVKRIKSVDGELLRPYVSSVNCPNPVWNSVMTSCWAEDISSRPDFASVLQMWRQTNDGKQVLPVDKMLKLLQNHSEHLDNLVTQRKLQLAAEKKRLEYLVERMLPRSIIEQLNTGKRVLPEEFSDVTVFISDIVAFTELSANCEPEEIVALLSNLYTLFDNVMDKYDVYKVEIIGDAYIAASGVPQRNYHHASEIGKMALHILTSISEFRMPTKPDRLIKIRIGVHSGPVVGGIVGKKMPHYCLFGDTLVTAGILETSCSPMHIHVSEATNQLLEQSYERFVTVYRGKLMLPAKGEMKTYYIVGMENFDHPLLAEMGEGIERKHSLILVDVDYRLVSDRPRIQSVPAAENYEVFQSNDSRRFSGDSADRTKQQEPGKPSSLPVHEISTCVNSDVCGQATAGQVASDDSQRG